MTTIIKLGRRNVARFNCPSCGCEFVTDIKDPSLFSQSLDGDYLSKKWSVEIPKTMEMDVLSKSNKDLRFETFFMSCPVCETVCASVQRDFYEEDNKNDDDKI